MSPRITTTVAALAAGLLACACGGATRTAAPQQPGRAGLTAAKVGPRAERVLVAEKGSVSMVERGGCLASIATKVDAAGSADELRVRCPRAERIAAWFAGLDQMTASVAVEEMGEDENANLSLPAAELITAGGNILRVKSEPDVARLHSEVRALAAELAASEMPSPGPRSTNGWQMLRVVGPAHVFLGGQPTQGTFEARMSTNGQYLCDFTANTDAGPIRATKSGWLAAEKAARAIDEVLAPFSDVTGGERRSATFAAGVVDGNERRASAASTAAVFKRFAAVQDVLGDACLPELDAPAGIGL